MKVKVKLLCIFGSKQPNTIIELEKEQAEKMILAGQATVSTEENTPTTKELSVMKGLLTKASNEIEVLKIENNNLQTKIKNLTAEKEK